MFKSVFLNVEIMTVWRNKSMNVSVERILEGMKELMNERINL